MVSSFYISAKHGFKNLFNIRPEKSPSIFLSSLVIGITALIYLNAAYKDYPNKFPLLGIDIFEMEFSFVQSVLKGANYPRKHAFYFIDPMHANHPFIKPVCPLLYTSALCCTGFTYAEASMVISFLNIISAVVSLCFYAGTYTKMFVVAVLCYFFNGGWAFFRNYGETSYNNDLIHEIGRNIPTPGYQITAFFLTLSKESSYAIPMAILTIALAQLNRQSHSTYFLAGILASLNPSISTCFALFITISCYHHSWKYILPFAVSIAPKLIINPQISYKPMWQEYQMDGYFYSQILEWFDAFGFPFIMVLLIPIYSYYYNSVIVHRFFAVMSSFVFLCFIRFGNDIFENSIGIHAVFFPYVLVLFAEFLSKRYHYIGNKMMRGAFIAISLMAVSVYVLGGIISMRQMVFNKKICFQEKDFEVGHQMEKLIPMKEVVFCDSIYFNPISAIAGRQVYLANSKYLWKIGADIHHEIDVIHHARMTLDAIPLMEDLGYKYLLESSSKLFIATNSSQLEFFDIVYRDENYVLFRLHNN